MTKEELPAPAPKLKIVMLFLNGKNALRLNGFPFLTKKHTIFLTLLR